MSTDIPPEIQEKINNLPKGATYIGMVKTPEQVKREMPLNDQQKRTIETGRAEVTAVIKGEDTRKILIIGPCSAHLQEPVEQYAKFLKTMKDKYSKEFVIIMRLYTNKPRTDGSGYKGVAEGKAGEINAREMALIAINQGVPIADEMLYPKNTPYIDDIVSYVAIGARSVGNQEQRLTLSTLQEIPAGMKNPLDGDMKILMNSIYAAQSKHEIEYNNIRIKTSGNPLAHVILRGVDQQGKHKPNYHAEDCEDVVEVYHAYKGSSGRKLENPSIIIDASHSNSRKEYERQPIVAQEILRSCINFPKLNPYIKGIMVESYLKDGKCKSGAPDDAHRDPNHPEFGMSITDACLGTKKTEALLENLAQLQRQLM